LVRNVGANYTLRIKFDDDTQHTVNISNKKNINYVPPESVRRVMTGNGADKPLYQP
jgi:threonine dehydratase